MTRLCRVKAQMEQDSYQDQAAMAPPTAEVVEQSRVGRQIAATRKSRTRNWPDESTIYERFSSLEAYKATMGDYVHTIGKGMTSGRNLLAYFDDRDDIPRIKFNIRLEHGRSKKLWPNYPHPSEELLPVGITLAQICSRYPLHCWADGLRIFMAENWNAERIWHCLPADARNEGASVRKWNYLQQAMGREADKMYEEDENTPRVIIKRKKDEAEFEDDNAEDTAEELQDARPMTFEVSEVAAGAPTFLSPSTCAPVTFASTAFSDITQQAGFSASVEYIPQSTSADTGAGDTDFQLNFDPEYDTYFPSVAFSRSPQADGSQEFAAGGFAVDDFASPSEHQSLRGHLELDSSMFSPQSSHLQSSEQGGSSLSPDMDAIQYQIDARWRSQSSTLPNSCEPQAYQQTFQNYQPSHFQQQAKSDLADLDWPPQNTGYVVQHRMSAAGPTTMSPWVAAPAYGHAVQQHPVILPPQQLTQAQYLQTQQQTGRPVMWDTPGVNTNNYQPTTLPFSNGLAYGAVGQQMTNCLSMQQQAGNPQPMHGRGHEEWQVTDMSGAAIDNFPAGDIIPSVEYPNTSAHGTETPGSQKSSQQSIVDGGSPTRRSKKRKTPDGTTQAMAEASESGRKRKKTTSPSQAGTQS